MTVEYQRFLLGVPVRANVKVHLKSVPLPAPLGPMNPTSGGLAPRRTRTVVEGDSLASIAYQEYRDPNRWRALAGGQQHRRPDARQGGHGADGARPPRGRSPVMTGSTVMSIGVSELPVPGPGHGGASQSPGQQCAGVGRGGQHDVRPVPGQAGVQGHADAILLPGGFRAGDADQRPGQQRRGADAPDYRRGDGGRGGTLRWRDAHHRTAAWTGPTG